MNIVVFAGPNGSGKSSIYGRLTTGIKLISLL